MEEVQSMLIRFTDDSSHDVGMGTEEVKLNLFKRKKELKSAEGKEEQKLFEEERQKREAIIKNVISLNKLLIEERNKKEEEAKNNLKGRTSLLNKRGSSNQRIRKGKKILKTKVKATIKNGKKLRRNTVLVEEKIGTVGLTSMPSEESKQTTKSKLQVNPHDISRRTQSMSKMNGKVFRKMSDPFSPSK